MVIISYSLYSVDLVLYDFFIFPKLKMVLRNGRFNDKTMNQSSTVAGCIYFMKALNQSTFLGLVTLSPKDIPLKGKTLIRGNCYCHGEINSIQKPIRLHHMFCQRRYCEINCGESIHICCCSTITLTTKLWCTSLSKK
jgi:hypothetical protein